MVCIEGRHMGPKNLIPRVNNSMSLQFCCIVRELDLVQLHEKQILMAYLSEIQNIYWLYKFRVVSQRVQFEDELKFFVDFVRNNFLWALVRNTFLNLGAYLRMAAE